MKLIKKNSLIGVLLSFSTLLSAQETDIKRPPVINQLPFINQTIQLDAVLDETVWQEALKVELNYETSPAENTAPPVKTDVFLFENGDTLYVGFKAYDPTPSAIRDYLTDRDNIWDSDFVGIKFDTFGESRKAFQFFTNALGVQADATQEDFNGDDDSWDAIWSSKGRVNSEGYIVEMAIPFKALRFPDTGQKQSWGIEILRFLPRDVRHRLANAPVNRDIPCRICQFDRLEGFSNIKPSKSLQLVPTLVVGKTDIRKEPATDPWKKGSIKQSPGLDFRWGITQDMILNATINPDFSQVEADNAELDVNNTFSIFFQEKRPFFLDGADYFNTPNRLLHTRDIIEPDYGVKLTGQTNNHSFGLFAVNDKHTSFLIPGNQGSELVLLENQSSENQVVRYSLDLGNKNNVGLLMTNRSGDDYANTVISVDGKYWFDQNHSVTVQYMSSDSQYSDKVMQEYEQVANKDISDNAYTINFQHNSRNWWGYINHQDFGKDFRADLGFISKVNFDKSVVGLGHRWFPNNSQTWWTEISLGGDWDITHDNSGRKLEEETEMNFEIEGALQSSLGIGYGKRNRYFDKEQLDDTPGETFDEQYLYTFAFVRPISQLRIGSVVEWSDAIDFSNSRLGESLRVSPEINWQLGQHWSTDFEYNRVDFDVAGGNLFKAKVANLKVTYQIDVRSFVRFTLQSLDIKRTPSLYIKSVDKRSKSNNRQILYSYKINPQTLFFAGYSDQGVQNDDLSQFEKTGKSLFMKFSYAWQL